MGVSIASVYAGGDAVRSIDRKVVRFGGRVRDLSDPQRVIDALETDVPATVFPLGTVLVLDLSGKRFSPASLRELVVPLGQRLRGGMYGDLRLVLVTDDLATREFLELLARRYELPLFAATSIDDVDHADPLGELTASEARTLNEIADAGWQVTVSGLARLVGIEPTAANNRLVNLERKGYVYRFTRHRRQGDLFVDPRVPRTVMFEVDREAPPMTAALARAGIATNPYDTRPLRLEGEAAEHAAEILRRRGKAR